MKTKTNFTAQARAAGQAARAAKHKQRKTLAKQFNLPVGVFYPSKIVKTLETLGVGWDSVPKGLLPKPAKQEESLPLDHPIFDTPAKAKPAKAKPAKAKQVKQVKPATNNEVVLRLLEITAQLLGVK